MQGNGAGYGAVEIESGRLLLSETNRGMALSLSRTGHHLAVARVEGGKEELALVDLATGKRIHTAVPPPDLLTNSAGGIFTIKGLGESEFPLAEAAALKAPPAPLVTGLRDPTDNRPPRAEGFVYIPTLRVSPDNRLVVMQCIHGKIAVFDARTKSLLSILRGFPRADAAGGDISAILISPDSRLVACASRRGEVAIWRLPQQDGKTGVK